MSCPAMGDGTPIPCTATYQKWTGQPITSAGSKNSLPLGMGNVNVWKPKQITSHFKNCKWSDMSNQDFKDGFFNMFDYQG